MSERESSSIRVSKVSELNTEDSKGSMHGYLPIVHYSHQLTASIDPNLNQLFRMRFCQRFGGVPCESFVSSYGISTVSTRYAIRFYNG